MIIGGNMEDEKVDERLVIALNKAADEWGAYGVIKRMAQQFPDAYEHLLLMNAQEGIQSGRIYTNVETPMHSKDVYSRHDHESTSAAFDDMAPPQDFQLMFGAPFDLHQAVYILRFILPRWWEQFLVKNRKYKDVDQTLGPRGVFPDINRKVGILKSRIWLGNPDVDESTTAVINDLIGHLVLLLYITENEPTPASHRPPNTWDRSDMQDGMD